MNKAKTFLKTSLSALVEINAPNKEPITRPENILRKLFHKIVLFFKCTLIAESELITIQANAVPKERGILISSEYPIVE